MSVYNTQEIMEILPHRHPFLLIDTIEELEPGVRAVGLNFRSPFSSLTCQGRCMALRESLWITVQIRLRI